MAEVVVSCCQPFPGSLDMHGTKEDDVGTNDTDSTLEELGIPTARTGPDNGQVTTRITPPEDYVDLTADSEPPMLDIGNRLGDHILDPGQGLMALVKPLSVTLLGGSRYRAVLKIGQADKPDGLACILIDSAAHAFTVEGSLADVFASYADHDDPLVLTPGERQRWFACRAVEEWVDRLMKSDALRETAVWVA